MQAYPHAVTIEWVKLGQITVIVLFQFLKKVKLLCRVTDEKNEFVPKTVYIKDRKLNM